MFTKFNNIANLANPNFNLFISFFVCTLLIYQFSDTPRLKKFFLIETNSLKISLFSIGLAAFNFLIIILVGLLLGAKYEINFSTISIYSSLDYLWQIAIAAGMEELAVRGLLLLSLIHLLGESKAIVFTSIVFAGLHLYNPNLSVMSVLNVFIAGVAFSSFILINKSLLPTLIFHICWNFLEYIAISSHVSGISFSFPNLGHLDMTQISGFGKFILGDKFGIEEGFICTLLLISNIYFFKFFTDKTNLIAVKSNAALLRSKIAFSEYKFKNK